MCQGFCLLFGVLRWFLWVIPYDNFVNVIFVNKAAWDNRKTPGLGIRWGGFQPANCWSSVEPQAVDVFLLNVSFLLVHADLCSSDSLSRADFANLSCILGFEHPFTVLCSRSVHPSEALGVFSKHTHTQAPSLGRLHLQGVCVIPFWSIAVLSVPMSQKNSFWCLL